MIRRSIAISGPVYLLYHDQKKCKWIANFIILQCFIMFILSITVLQCFWKINRMKFDYYKLACIMYLYDKSACGYTMEVAKSISYLMLSNDTKGLNILPIKWKPAIVTVSTRLSTKTRTHIEVSIAFHIIWCLTAIAVKIITRNNKHPKVLGYIMSVFFYVTIFITFFDLSMAIVYVAHIKQSLTNGMIVRYSGWNLELSLSNYDSFAGWLPIAASVCWLRGVVVMAINVYFLKKIYFIRLKIKKREICRRFENENNFPIPEPIREKKLNNRVLYFRPGEMKPLTYRSSYY